MRSADIRPSLCTATKGARRNAGVTLGITFLASGVEAYLQPGPFEVRADPGYRQLWAVRTVKSASGFKVQSLTTILRSASSYELQNENCGGILVPPQSVTTLAKS